MDIPKSNQKIKIIVISAGVVGLLGAGYFLGSRGKPTTTSLQQANPGVPAIKLSNTPNTNAIYLASPVMAVNGKVTSKSKDSLSIETNSYAQPGGESKVVKLKVKVPENIQFYKQPLSLPYLSPEKAATANTQATQPTIKDINNGDYVSLGLLTDYRFTKDSELSASSVTIIPSSNSLNGTITSVSSRTIKVKGDVPNSFPGAQATNVTPEPAKEYTVTLPNDVELNSYTSTGAKTASLSDLKTGYSVNIYGKESIKSTSFDAAIVYVTIPAVTETAPATPIEATPAPTRAATPTPTPEVTSTITPTTTPSN